MVLHVRCVLCACVGLGMYGSDSESEKSPTPGSHLLPELQGRTIAVIERGDYRGPPERSQARTSRWDSKMREKEGSLGGIDGIGMVSSRDRLGHTSSTSEKKGRHRSRSPRDKSKDRSSRSGSSRDQHDSSSSKSSKGSGGKDRHHSSSRRHSSSKERKSSKERNSSSSSKSKSSSSSKRERSRSRSPRSKSHRRSRSRSPRGRKGRSRSPSRRQK